MRSLRESPPPGRSQKEAAKALGVAAPTLSQIENGKAEPGLEFIHRAARLYEVHPNVILGVIYMREFEFDEVLAAEAAGILRVEHVLKAGDRESARRRLRGLGYGRFI